MPSGKPVVDLINLPPHYRSHPSGVEVIEITEHLNFNVGNTFKYIARAPYKGYFADDLRKAIWYLHRTEKYPEVPWVVGDKEVFAARLTSYIAGESNPEWNGVLHIFRSILGTHRVRVLTHLLQILSEEGLKEVQ